MLQITDAPLVDSGLLRLITKIRCPLVRLELVRCGSLDQSHLTDALRTIAPSIEALNLSACQGFSSLHLNGPMSTSAYHACMPCLTDLDLSHTNLAFNVLQIMMPQLATLKLEVR